MKKPFDPFRSVDCKYGAPRGRRDAKHILDVSDGSLIARHCGGTDCYDKGGAYWGAPLNIWAVWNRGKGPETVTYVRADNADQAKSFALGIHPQLTPY